MVFFLIKKNESFKALFFFVVLFFLLYPIFFSSVHVVSLGNKPSCFLEHMFFVLRVLCYAGLEEFLYRAYFPHSFEKYLLYAFKNVKERRLSCVAKFSSCILFSLAHLYLGIFNVFFAFFVALFFIWLYNKIRKHNVVLAFVAVWAVHFVFNIVSFYLFVFTY